MPSHPMARRQICVFKSDRQAREESITGSFQEELTFSDSGEGHPIWDATELPVRFMKSRRETLTGKGTTEEGAREKKTRTGLWVYVWVYTFREVDLKGTWVKAGCVPGIGGLQPAYIPGQ